MYYFFAIIFPIICLIFMAFGVLYIVKFLISNDQEKKAYEVMLLNPNDSTVSNYIQAFLLANKYSSNVRVEAFGFLSTDSSATRLSKKLRQAQGYQIIMQNPNVSDQVKEQLRKAFVSKGVPIQ